MIARTRAEVVNGGDSALWGTNRCFTERSTLHQRQRNNGRIGGAIHLRQGAMDSPPTVRDGEVGSDRVNHGRTIPATRTSPVSVPYATSGRNPILLPTRRGERKRFLVRDDLLSVGPGIGD